MAAGLVIVIIGLDNTTVGDGSFSITVFESEPEAFVAVISSVFMPAFRFTLKKSWCDAAL